MGKLYRAEILFGGFARPRSGPGHAQRVEARRVPICGEKSAVCRLVSNSQKTSRVSEGRVKNPKADEGHILANK